MSVKTKYLLYFQNIFPKLRLEWLYNLLVWSCISERDSCYCLEEWWARSGAGSDVELFTVSCAARGAPAIASNSSSCSSPSSPSGNRPTLVCSRAGGSCAGEQPTKGVECRRKTMRWRASAGLPHWRSSARSHVASAADTDSGDGGRSVKSRSPPRDSPRGSRAERGASGTGASGETSVCVPRSSRHTYSSTVSTYCTSQDENLSVLNNHIQSRFNKLWVYLYIYIQNCKIRLNMENRMKMNTEIKFAVNLQVTCSAKRNREAFY